MSLPDTTVLSESGRVLSEARPDDGDSNLNGCRCNDALVPGALVPAVIGGTTAVIASAMTAERSVKREPISVTAETVVQAALNNSWTLLGELVSVGGWALLLIVLVPMLVSWLMPGPVQFKTKK